MDTSTPVFYTLSLHDALPISCASVSSGWCKNATAPCLEGSRFESPRIYCERVHKPYPVIRPGGSLQCGSPCTPRSPRSRSRSEEHTSELQSRRDLVCRLLLEK